VPAAALNHPQPPATQPRLQVVHKQPSGEPLLDVRTEDGQELAGLPASECCLQVGLRKPVAGALPAASAGAVACTQAGSRHGEAPLTQPETLP
jgi:hypothetical protein